MPAGSPELYVWPIRRESTGIAGFRAAEARFFFRRSRYRVDAESPRRLGDKPVRRPCVSSVATHVPAMRRRTCLLAPVTYTGARRSHLEAEFLADDHLLDLAGTFGDRSELRVTVVPLNRVLDDVAVAAVNLDCFTSDVIGDLSGEVLRH